MDQQLALGSVTQSLRTAMKEVTDDMQMCILNCVQCHQVCEQMIQHCLNKGGAHAEPSHILLLQDCAEICAASADFMLRKSDFHSHLCGVCSTVCQACARDCEGFEDDEMMQMCEDVCKRCAETCSNMATHH